MGVRGSPLRGSHLTTGRVGSLHAAVPAAPPSTFHHPPPVVRRDLRKRRASNHAPREPISTSPASCRRRLEKKPHDHQPMDPGRRGAFGEAQIVGSAKGAMAPRPPCWNPVGTLSACPPYPDYPDELHVAEAGDRRAGDRADGERWRCRSADSGRAARPTRPTRRLVTKSVPNPGRRSTAWSGQRPAPGGIRRALPSGEKRLSRAAETPALQ